jgi:lipopolysaccharide transport system ATP-binding protein
MKPIIEVEHLSKLFRLGSIGATTLRDSVQRWFASRRPAREGEPAQEDPGEFWALRDVSFQIDRGEVVGVVGRNGAGKSTLLKVLSRITEPTSGRAVLRGRVASLLEVGTGFHPDLTGRENIFLNGAILGMRRAEIARKFDAIVDFAEIGRFIDTPVKRYSSGMYVRLAFAVAAHLDPEILIIDEVLAVGDAAFQQKCLGKMGEVARTGRTVLFVSHNMASVQALCTRAVLMERGTVAFVGATEAALVRYLENGSGGGSSWKRPPGEAAAPLQFSAARATLEGTAPYLKLHLELQLTSSAAHRPAFIAVDILNNLGASLMQALPTPIPFISDTQPAHSVRVMIELPPLIPGQYSLSLWAGPHNSETYDAVERGLTFSIETSPTRNRTFAHTPDHGYVVPPSTYEYPAGATAAGEPTISPALSLPHGS